MIRDTKFQFVGAWANNRPEGYGKVTTKEGDIYEGMFKNGLKHGTGVEKFIEGGAYIGNYRDGLPDGHGKLKDKDGTVYIGQFKAGKKHGVGTWALDVDAKSHDAEF